MIDGRGRDLIADCGETWFGFDRVPFSFPLRSTVGNDDSCSTH
jgi:hypothetical protein